MSHPRLTLSVLLAVALVSALGTLITDGPRAAILPGAGVVLGTVSLIALVKQPAPTPWARWQTFADRG
jgi:hypothetical protein